MAIIYSYPQVVQPALSDLLVGTDVSTKNKVTKSFSIQSIVDLVETAVPGGGTVTSIDTNSSTFITLSGGPISTTGTITASLSATGVPTSTKFLRGDNTWATPPGGTDTTYTISSAQNGSAANIRLTGSDGGQNIVTLIAGANITLTDNGSNAITIAAASSTGGVTNVNAGTGLKLESGTPGQDPVIGVDYVGSNNFILKGESQTTITEQDYIPFNDISSGSVKTTTMGVIPPSALSLVKQYIDAGDANDVTNSSDSFTTTAKVQKIVSLTSAEYASITPDANTLYLIVGALPTFTVTLAFTNTISGTEYTIGGDQAGSTQEGISGSSYAFNTTISPNPGFFFSSGPTVTNAVGTITTNETVYTLLSGTVEAIPISQCTATLFVNTSGVTGTQFTLGGDLTGATDTGDCPNDYSFNTTITANSGYEFTSGPVITNASGQVSGDQTVQTTITGVIEAIAPPPVTVTASLNLSNLTGVQGEVSGSVSPGSYSGDSPLAYSFTPSATANSGYSIENLTFTGDLSGTATQSKTAVIYANGNVVADPVDATVELFIDDRITGGENGVAYDLSGNLDGATQSGPVPFSYAFNTYVTVRPNWEFTTGPTVQNASGTTSQEGLQTETTVITGSVQEIVTPVTATLNVIENISGSQVYSITGDQDGATQSGAPDFTYSFTTGVSIPSGYEWTDGPDITPTQPNVGTISTNTTVNTTISGTIAAIIEPGTVNLAFSNNVNGFENTTTALGASTSITGPVGDPYTFTNSISANSGYEFTTGPTWDPNAVITGTIASGTTNLTQTVTGAVTEVAPPSCNVNVGYTFSIFTICDAPETTPITMYHLGACDICGATSIDASFVSGMSINDVVQVKYNGVYMPFQKQSAGSVAVSNGSCLACPPPPEEYTVTLAFSNNVSGSENTTTSLSPGATITGNAGDAYQFVHTITPNSGYEFTSGPTWVDNVSNNGTGTINGTIPSSNTTITQSVSGTVEAVAPSYTELSLRMNLNNAPYGWTSSTLACDGTGTTLAVYVQPIYSNWNDVVGSNAKVYTDQNLTTILAATGGNEYYQEGSDNYLRIDNTGDALSYASCPVEPTYNYYFAEPCGGGTTIYMRSVTAFSPGEVFKLSGDDTCYEVGASGAPINSNDPVESFPDCSACLPAQVTVTLDFTNNVTNDQFTTTSLSPGASITGTPGDSYQFVHTITADTGYEFTSGPTWTDSVSNNGTGTINGTIPNSNTTITQSVSGVVEQEVVECNCITVDVLNTQLTDGGLNLYYIFNSCGAGETSVDLTSILGVEQNGSTYFAFCEQGAGGNLYKYGPNGSPFVGLPGMNTTPNQTSCSADFDCFPVVP